ncbi:MAG TPA: sensor domain-containing diguanylate cyclase [Solirubrobacteraceae bacterium]|jgi:diguanylate cyclase (GGDEF)-like protein|nr:sensor domain-containing diguanylate cyclase [Solirubrobacteraceae bacterium]
MDVVTGTDASASPGGVERLLEGVRRLMLLADGSAEAGAIFRALARELLSVTGGEEVHVHHLANKGEEDEQVAVYMFDGYGRLSYLIPRSERPPGVGWVASSGRSFVAGDPRELAESMPRLAASGLTNCALLLPLSERGEVEAVVVIAGGLSESFTPQAVELATVLVDQAATALALVRARAEAGTDAITGGMNHRAMRRRLDEEIGRAQRGGSPLSCLLIDLDNFKLVNDRHGHPAGDAMLREVVQALVGEFRAFDRVARYGGDEFVVILPNADLESAAAAATRALERLRELPALADTNPGVSASIGVAQWRPRMTTDQLLEACDVALLRSKREGKGRVTRASERSG